MMAQTFAHMVNIIRRVIFFAAIAFIIVALFSFTIAQEIPYEFKDPYVSRDFYDVIMGGFPLAILFTLFGTIRDRYSTARKSFTILVTVSTAVLAFFVMIQMLFSVGFAVWSDVATLYKHKTREDTTIRQEVHEYGVFGRGGSRMVIVQPVLWYWYKVKEVDTATIKKNDWILVDENDRTLKNN